MDLYCCEPQQLLDIAEQRLRWWVLCAGITPETVGPT